MAKQTSLIQLEGTIGNVTLYKTKDGSFAKLKASPSKASRDRTKENVQELTHASKGGKLIRNAFASIITDMKDSFLVRRLNSQMSGIIKSDRISPRGHRNLLEGDIELLQGFEFNSDKALSTVLKTPYTATIDRATGVMKVAIPAFIPSKLIGKPEGATHFRFTIAGAIVNFETFRYETVQKTGDELLLANIAGPAISLEVQLPPASTTPLMLALGISFSQEVNGAYYPVGEGLFNAISFVAISGS